MDQYGSVVAVEVLRVLLPSHQGLPPATQFQISIAETLRLSYCMYLLSQWLEIPKVFTA